MSATTRSDLNVVKVISWPKLSRGILWIKYEDGSWYFVSRDGNMLSCSNPELRPSPSDKVYYRRPPRFSIRRVKDGCGCQGPYFWKYCWEVRDRKYPESQALHFSSQRIALRCIESIIRLRY